jgi:hypothetical protein
LLDGEYDEAEQQR